MMENEDRKHLLIVEFNSQELRSAYSGISIEEHILDNTWIVHVVDEHLKENHNVEERIIETPGTISRKDLNLFIQHLNEAQENTAYIIE